MRYLIIVLLAALSAGCATPRLTSLVRIERGGVNTNGLHEACDVRVMPDKIQLLPCEMPK